VHHSKRDTFHVVHLPAGRFEKCEVKMSISSLTPTLPPAAEGVKQRKNKPRKYTFLITGYEVESDPSQDMRTREAYRTLARMLVKLEAEEQDGKAKADNNG
jgi:hypothetical protein